MVPGAEVLRVECTKADQRPLEKVAVTKTELYYSMSCGETKNVEALITLQIERAGKPVSRETILTTKMWQSQSREGQDM